MKVDEESKKELVENLKKWADRTIFTINQYVKNIEGSNTEEELMEMKNNLLYEYIFEVPFGPDLCYFCILQGLNVLLFKKYDEKKIDETCLTCPYGKVHGSCEQGGDDYSKISSLYDQFLSLIEQGTYFNYERYDR